MKITKSELKEMIRECLREELNSHAVNLKEGGFTDAVKGMFGKKEEPIYSEASCKEIQKMIDAIVVNIQMDGNYDRLADYNYDVANREFVNHSPKSDRTIGLIRMSLKRPLHRLNDHYEDTLTAIEVFTEYTKSHRQPLRFIERDDIAEANGYSDTFIEIQRA